MNYLDDLLFWVTERDEIRKKKELKLPKPWTDNPILQTYRFCNVYREDDRVTKWIHENWLLSAEWRGHINMPFAMCVARMVNLPETLEELGFPQGWEPGRFIEVLASRKSTGLKVWTSAYMITGGYSAGGESKEVIIARVLSQAYKNLNNTATAIAKGDSLDVAASKIVCPGIGSFLSAQVVADLKYDAILLEAKDWSTWCSPGPGSTMGLNFLHGRDPGTNTTEERFMKEVHEVQAILKKEIQFDLCAQNTQNCLCEFSKYVRAKHFGRRLKSRYVPYAGG